MALLRTLCCNPTSLVLVLAIHKRLPQLVSGILHATDHCCCGGCEGQEGSCVLSPKLAIIVPSLCGFARIRCPPPEEKTGFVLLCWMDECSLMKGAKSSAAWSQLPGALPNIGCECLQVSPRLPLDKPCHKGTLGDLLVLHQLCHDL